jgi:restriction endonuclease S subunit
MQKRLGDIASITTGVYDKMQPSGDTLYLQGAHFNEYGQLREDIIIKPELLADERLAKHLLTDGDILLIAKGGSNRACIYHREIGKAVASSIFFVVRLFDRQLLPEFLQWYLNTSYMQDVFSGLSIGTHISSLSKKVLSEIEVPVLPLKNQKEILHAQLLWDKEKALSIKLLTLKEALYENLLLNQTKSIK